MHSRFLSAVLYTACLAVGACTSLVKPTNAVPASFSSSSTIGISNVVYRSEALAFTIELPSGWYLRPGDDTDPHFYETKECSEQDNITCAAFEVQNHDTQFAEGPDGAFRFAESEGLKPQKRSALIPDATVIETGVRAGAEGWYFEYHVFFPKAKRRFLIFSNDKTLENDIFPTMKAMK